mgnify:CR=1 FL=1|tara:strand:+ start:576 stop:887 length:312 start_codon:yes stop_codon:yes gene_type:complete
MTLFELFNLFTPQLALTQEEIRRLDRLTLVANRCGDPKLPQRQQDIQAMQNNLVLRMIEWNETDQETLIDCWWNIGSMAYGEFGRDMDHINLLAIERVLSFRT